MLSLIRNAAMVRPHLEYANVIWHPRYRGVKLEVEKVQRRATKLIPSINHLPHNDRLPFLKLPFLKLPSFYFRKRRGDMIHVFKIMNGMDRLNPNNFFIFLPTNRTTGRSQKVFTGQCRLDLRRCVFSQRSVHGWNSLPEHVISCASLNSFKSHFGKFWKVCYRLP